MLLRTFRSVSFNFKRNVSALFVTGDKAKEICAILTPKMDFAEKFKNINGIEENIKRRKLKIDLETITKEWEIYKTIQSRKKSMEERRVEIAKIMKDNPNEGLVIQGRQIREDLKLLKENSYYLEDQFVHNFLSLPNDIHQKTPNEKEVIYEYLVKNESESPQNLEDLIEHFDSFTCFTKDEAAKFDVFCSFSASDHFKNNNFLLFSNPDFSRSVIVEGAGVDSKDAFLIKEEDIENKLNLLHLTGKASIFSYLAYVTKLSVFPSSFPMKFVTNGKQYRSENQESKDLWNQVQHTCCQVFVSVLEESEADQSVEELIELYKKFYEKFHLHFRIVSYPAHQLNISESYKIGFEIYSPSKKSYVEVGNISNYGNFISQRLLFTCKEGKNFKYPQIISGTAVDVTKLLLVLIENCQAEKFKCPEFILN